MAAASRELAGKRVVVANWRDLDHSMAGGAETYAWELARGLSDAGAHVVFLTAREAGDRRSQYRDGIRVVRGGGQLGYYLFAVLWLLAHRRSLDLVVDMEAGIPQFSPLVVNRRRTALMLFVHHVHLDQFDTYFPPSVARLGRFLEGTVMPRVYRSVTTVAVSGSTREAMVERLGWTGPIELLHNGNPSPVALRVAEEDTVDRLVVLGRLSPHKRVDMVIRAVAALTQARPQLHLDILGKGPERERLEQLVAELDVEKNVTFRGFVTEEDKGLLLAHARLHVCASDVEGWGQVVCEAAAHGVPTVARDVPGLRDSVRHQQTGWLLPNGSDRRAAQASLPIAIQNALDELEDPERREEITTACTTWAAQYDWESMRTGAVALAELTMKGAS
jgi:glycosyltransferase involved in cell wall biosynthesis